MGRRIIQYLADREQCRFPLTISDLIGVHAAFVLMTLEDEYQDFKVWGEDQVSLDEAEFNRLTDCILRIRQMGLIECSSYNEQAIIRIHPEFGKNLWQLAFSKDFIRRKGRLQVAVTEDFELWPLTQIEACGFRNADAQALKIMPTPTETENLPLGLPDELGYVYLKRAVSTDRYKIGVTKDIRSRVKGLQRQAPFPLQVMSFYPSLDPYKEEARWHSELKSKRVNGEWFELKRKDVREFCELASEETHIFVVGKPAVAMKYKIRDLQP